MRETELWRRLDRFLGAGYARSWAQLVILPGLGGLTTVDALAAGVPVVDVWRAVWAQLELPESER